MEPKRNSIDGQERSEGTGRYNQSGVQNSQNINEGEGKSQHINNSRDISDIDQQEGTMDNGATGGNFEGESGEENY